MDDAILCKHCNTRLDVVAVKQHEISTKIQFNNKYMLITASIFMFLVIYYIYVFSSVKSLIFNQFHYNKNDYSFGISPSVILPYIKSSEVSVRCNKDGLGEYSSWIVEISKDGNILSWNKANIKDRQDDILIDKLLNNAKANALTFRKVVDTDIRQMINGYKAMRPDKEEMIRLLDKL